MKTLRRMIYAELAKVISFVTFGFLALYYFFDILDQLRDIGQGINGGFGMLQAMLFAASRIPANMYSLLPITVMIGSIFVLSSYAKTQEFTIMRTSGLGPWQALRSILVVGLVAALCSFVIGDYISPQAQKAGIALRAKYMGETNSLGQTGAWLKESRDNESVTVNVRSYSVANMSMAGIRIYTFNKDGRLRRSVNAATGQIQTDGTWLLKQVHLLDMEYRLDAAKDEAASVGFGQGIINTKQSDMPELAWKSQISPDMLSAAVLQPERMNTLDLYTFIQHLRHNAQSSQLHEIEFWRKVFYPFSALVMVVLALPFAYLHFRSGGIATYVFGGVMLGISFYLLNNVFGYLGYLRHWTPWLAAITPSLAYTLISLSAFVWLVLRR